MCGRTIQLELIVSKSELLAKSEDKGASAALIDNVLNPFMKGTGIGQLYNNFAAKKVEHFEVPSADALSTQWTVQTLSTAAGAVLAYAAAGKLAGRALGSLSKNAGIEGGLKSALQNETGAQILGAGLYDLAKAPNNHETRIGNAASSMIAFSIFSGGNHLLSSSSLLSSSHKVYQGLGRIAVGAAGGLAGLESNNMIASATGAELKALSNQDRLSALVQGGFINLALPAVQARIGQALDYTKTSPASTRVRLSKAKDLPGDELNASPKSSPENAARGESPSIMEANAAYEAWMAKQIRLVDKDLQAKHKVMAEGPFDFLRGTYFRWAERFPRLLPDLQDAPIVNSIGDMHVRNLGVWTGVNGRRVWGVNDFDEAAKLPYTNDLVRLLTSTRILHGESGLHLKRKEAARFVLSGYEDALRAGGKPFYLDEHPRLAKLVGEQKVDEAKFWKKLNERTRTIDESQIPTEAKTGLLSVLPAGTSKIRFGHREAGVGSLGRERFVAIGEHNGGFVVSEAKAWLPAANKFLDGQPPGKPEFPDFLKQAVHVQDPSIRVQDGWVLRDLSPLKHRVELSKLNSEKAERRLLYAMGFEAGNFHLGTGQVASRILQDLANRDKHWLADAAKTMKAANKQDLKEFREASKN